MFAQSGLDLLEFDAEPAQLDLLIFATEKLDPPIGTEPCQVSRLVQPRAWLAREWIGDKFLARQIRPIPITARHPFAANAQLSRYPDRYRLE